jgi:hypothetical protein
MRITFTLLASTLLASIVTMGIAVPALAQGYAGCPPGLAMKGNGCLPPGQAKKMTRGYASPPVEVYQPPIAYVPAYPDYYRPGPDYYRPSGGSLNLGVTVPLP